MAASSPRTPIVIAAFVIAGLAAPCRAQEGIPTVTVEAKKAPVVRKLDKTVHDAAALPRAENGTAQDALQSTPGVSVTADGRIAVNGNAQVTVLVDGKPTAALSGAGEERAVALQTMSGADIASIEVITNPSAAHDANGGAIVNLVLKRNRKPGLHAQAQGNAADDGLWNTGVSGDLTQGALSLHGSMAYRHDGTLKIRRYAIDWNDVDGGGQRQQSSRVFVHRNVVSAALDADLELSDTETLGLSARTTRRASNPLFDVRYEERKASGTSVFNRLSTGPNEQTDDSATLSYSRRRDGGALKATLQHSDTVGLVDKAWRDTYAVPALPDSYGHGATRPVRRIDEATVDWSRPWQRGRSQGQWSMGLDLQRQVDTFHDYKAAVDAVTGAETADPATTHDWAVRNVLAAAYVTGQARRGQWEAQLGVRAEHVALAVRAPSTRQSIAQSPAFHPSAHVRYAASEKTDLTVSYRRSDQRPDPRDRNPFVAYVDAHDLSRGNPRLLPPRVTSWLAEAATDRGNLNASLGAFYRASRGTVTDARTFDGDVLVTAKDNGGRARSAGITGELDWTATPQVQAGLDGGLYRVMLDTPDLGGVVRQRTLSGYLNVKASWHSGGEDVSLDAHVQSAAITPLGREGRTSSVNVAWKHRLTKALRLTVTATDVFDGSARTWRMQTAAFRQTGEDHFLARRVYVGFVYRTGAPASSE